jgi:ubiquinone/menaquinone biosynthesis C-methylase UbiE
MSPLARILLAAVAVFVVGQIVLRLLCKWLRFPAPAWFGAVLNSRLRAFLQPPAKVVERSGIRPGMRVLEIGCGSGAITGPAATAVGGSGSVFALDLQSGMLLQLRRKLRRTGHVDAAHVSAIRAQATALPIQPGCMDLVFMVTVLQEIRDRDATLADVHRVLRSGGVLAVTESLPDPDYPLKSTTVALCSRAGFALEAVDGSFCNYTARFMRP